MLLRTKIIRLIMNRLIATLGQNSALKKVTRKQIFDVDVPRACETITEPEAPLALRLQGNLLYGVSRVYFQQCHYVLSDAQAVHSTMRAKAMIDISANLDVATAKKSKCVFTDFTW
jgi:meiotic recombination protein REC8